MTTAVFKALCACFGLSPSSAEASVLIREAYQEPENAPRPPRSTDVIYFSIEPDSAAAEPPPEYTKETASGVSYTPVIASFAAWCLRIICYGPQALANARRIRTLLYVDGAGTPRCILRKAGIRPIPEPPEPLLLHEPEGSLWRLRCDLTIQLRREETHRYPAPLGTVPVGAFRLHH